MADRASLHPDGRRRCAWPGDDELMLTYHDEEWGVPLRDERGLYEHLVLDGAQAGLSWRTILHRREGYRRAFAGFDFERVARFGDRDVERLLGDPGIIRNRAKVESAIKNARAVVALHEAGETLSELMWSFVGGEPIVYRRRRLSDLPAETAESQAMSKEMKRRGFSFVGPTICYALMQAAGMVNDHLTSCFRHRELAGG